MGPDVGGAAVDMAGGGVGRSVGAMLEDLRRRFVPLRAASAGGKVAIGGGAGKVEAGKVEAGLAGAWRGEIDAGRCIARWSAVGGGAGKVLVEGRPDTRLISCRPSKTGP